MRRCSHCGHYGDPKTHCRPGNCRKSGTRRYRSLHKYRVERERCDQPPRVPQDSLFLYEWEEYRYNYFDDEESIRLLELLPGEPEDAIQCNLHTQPIRRSRPYQAISYTWGDPDDRGDILCEGKLLDIPRNLMHALQRFRRRTRARILWADGVCINQDDEQEKGHQVQMMRQIFERAQTVLVWLGRNYKIAAGPVFGSIRRLVMLQRAGQEVTMQRIFRGLTGYFWQHFLKVIRLPWFYRLWILQEIGLAAHANMHCGTATLNWTHLVEFCDIINHEYTAFIDKRVLDNCRFIFSIKDIDFRNKSSDSGNICNVLDLGTSQECSDVRDRIYGLLGHPAFQGTFSNPNSKFFLLVDYTIPYKKLYLHVSRMIPEIISYDPLYWLLYVRHDFNSFNDLDYPSWVLRWDIEDYPTILTTDSSYSRVFDAGGEELAELSFDSSVLSLRGFGFDKIAWRSDTFHRGSIPFNPSQALVKQNPHPLSQIWSYFGNTIASKGALEAIVIALCSPNTEDTCLLPTEEENKTLFLERLVSSLLAYVLEMGTDLSGFSLSDTVEDCDIFVFNYVFSNRCLFVTERGWVGAGHLVSSVGDEVCIFFGGQTPFVVHQLPSASESIYRLCGPCYVHGIMQGEAVKMWKDGNFESQTFNLV